MTADRELLAYVDGELAEADARAFEQRLASDPDLAEQVERHAALRRSLADLYGPLLAEPIPPALLAAASAPPVRQASRPQPVAWAMMAAGLLMGVVVGGNLPERGLVGADAQGRIVAKADLASALQSQVAADQQGKPIQIGLTFKTAAGDYCRTFQDARASLAGVACRQEDRWTTRLLTTYAPKADGDYRTAGSETPTAVLEAVDQLSQGDPLDAAAERDALARGWRR